MDVTRQKAIYEKEKGNTSFNNGRYQEAVEHYTNGIRCNPAEPTVLCNRAMAYLKLKEYAKAKIDCDLAVALDATYVKAIYRRALAYLGMNDLENARSNFRRVLELEPSNRQAQDELKKLEAGTSVKERNPPALKVARSEAESDPLVVTPVVNPPSEWKAQPLTRISIEEVTTSTSRVSIISNGIDQTAINNDNSKTDVTTAGSSSTQQCNTFEVPPVPETSVDFFARWGAMRRQKRLDVFRKYFLSIPPESYHTLFGCLIETDMLSDVIRAFGDSITHNIDVDTILSICNRLLKLSELDRFQVAYGFLEEMDKQAVKTIVTKLDAIANARNGDQADLVAKLKRIYEG